MKSIDIVDTSFAHAPGMSWYNVPQFVTWVRGNPARVPVRFFTDRCVGQVDNYPADMNVALLIEPITIDTTGYNVCLEKLRKFDYVLTYDSEFKQEKLGSKGLHYAIGGCWIKPQDMGIHPKTDLCSMIASGKTQTTGHRLRHEIAASADMHKVHLFGHGYNPVEFKFQALSRYMFSIAVENSQVNDMFTEKIIDCFLTGTVPIYWGTSGLLRYFNMDGVLQFNTLDELKDIVHGLKYETYAKMAHAIQDNYERALLYRVAEDRIFLDYPFLLP